MELLDYSLVDFSLFILFSLLPAPFIDQFLGPIHKRIKLTVTLSEVVLKLSFINLLISPDIHSISLLLI